MASASEVVIVDLNVGGVHYTTTLNTLTSDRCMPDSPLNRLAQAINENDVSWPRDSRGRWFIDRDGLLFRYVLDYIRTGSLTLPDVFIERRRLSIETAYFRLADGAIDQLNGIHSEAADPIVNGLCQKDCIAAAVTSQSNASKKSGFIGRATVQRGSVFTSSAAAVTDATVSPPGFITVGYRGTFSCGGRADGLSDVRFRKIWRVLVSGRVTLCRQVFGDTLNDSRNPDNAQYSGRFYLKHSSIERAFDALQAAGFQMVAACATGTNSGLSGTMTRGGGAALRTVGDLKASGSGLSASASATATFLVPISMTVESEEAKWSHYNEFVFCRPS